MRSELEVLAKKLREGYGTLFQQQWPALTGGILLGLLSILVAAWDRPWGIVGGIRNWADWLFYGLGVYPARPENPFLSTASVLDIGLISGAFASALMAQEFAFRRPPLIEMVKGLVGGVFMGIGAALSRGCNVGGFYSPLINLSAGGFPMLAGLAAGAFIGLKCLLWELEKFPAKPAPSPGRSEGTEFGWKVIQPYLGVLVFIGLILAAFLYSGRAYTVPGGLLLFGAAFGLVLQRCRFCFVRAFRDPFMTGDANIAKAVALSILIGAAGVSILKWAGFRSESMWVTPVFWWGSLAGGFVFGTGMVIAGGCGSGTLWRAAEGHLKLWAALFTFATTNSLATFWLKNAGWQQKLGKAVFLPDAFGWGGSLLFTALVMFLWYLAVTWNEETNRFTLGL
ncbi:MAG: YeeE/YedE thiosulfate transporter family protein [Bacillota bacterium]